MIVCTQCIDVSATPYSVSAATRVHYMRYIHIRVFVRSLSRHVCGSNSGVWVGSTEVQKKKSTFILCYSRHWKRFSRDPSFPFSIEYDLMENHRSSWWGDVGSGSSAVSVGWYIVTIDRYFTCGMRLNCCRDCGTWYFENSWKLKKIKIYRLATNENKAPWNDKYIYNIYIDIYINDTSIIWR